MYTSKDIQKRLKSLGYYSGNIDGIIGPETNKAVVRFKQTMGLRARPYIGPITLSMLFQEAPQARPTLTDVLPWINEISKYMGMHELENKKQLWAWLRSDKSSVGDPSKIPWCGDAVETSIKVSLPNEPFAGRVRKNPYLARNWLDFGVECVPSFGAVGVFWRGSRSGISGHVGFLVGVDPALKRYRVRGGNQRNRVSDTWIRMDRFLGAREPVTWDQELLPLPVLNSRGERVSSDEA